MPPTKRALGVHPAGFPAVPKVAHPGWGRNPIDGFIQARLETAGLSPSPEADRRTLIRRLSLDLIGPTAARRRSRAFLADGCPGRVRRARSTGCWLTSLSASAGRGSGSTRPVMPTPTATTSMPRARSGSIATGSSRRSTRACRSTGLQPSSSPATSRRGDGFAPRIATGFHRNTLINQEGGIDVEQFRVESIVDRVNTTGTVFLGLTVGCAQCHDHKYDPISQREYYQLFAFLQQRR